MTNKIIFFHLRKFNYINFIKKDAEREKVLFRIIYKIPQ